MRYAALLFLTVFLAACAHSQKTAPKVSPKSEPSAQLENGRAAIRQMAGCYLVDYSYTESEALKPGYKRDVRVYDVNKTRSLKEWIYADEISPRRIRLQHILFATGPDGRVIEGSELKHQADDWEFGARFRYDYAGPVEWKVVPQDSETWIRRVTNLDDGLRYQCASSFKLDGEYPEWSCDNYAPIPGRETRDMSRKDYSTLQRSTRLVLYGQSWLERQNNVKTIHENGRRTPLAKEIGKNWYVRLPDSECHAMKEFVKPRTKFWSLLRQTWDQVLDGKATFREKTFKPPRYAKMMEIEDKYLKLDLNDEKIAEQARQEILKTIEEFRVPVSGTAAN